MKSEIKIHLFFFHDMIFFKKSVLISQETFLVSDYCLHQFSHLKNMEKLAKRAYINVGHLELHRWYLLIFEDCSDASYQIFVFAKGHKRVTQVRDLEKGFFCLFFFNISTTDWLISVLSIHYFRPVLFRFLKLCRSLVIYLFCIAHHIVNISKLHLYC